MCILRIEHHCGGFKEHQVHLPHTTLKALYPPVVGIAGSNFCIALTSAGAQECRLRTIDGGTDPRDCGECPKCTDLTDLEEEAEKLRILKELDEMGREFKEEKEAEEAWAKEYEKNVKAYEKQQRDRESGVGGSGMRR